MPNSGITRYSKQVEFFLFLISIVSSVSSLMTKECQAHSNIVFAVQIVCNLVSTIGNATCLVTALQLGLDQMPDASAANFTSFIAWFVFVVVGGVWVSTTFVLSFSLCTQQDIRSPSFILEIYASTFSMPTHRAQIPSDGKLAANKYQYTFTHKTALECSLSGIT